MSPRAQVFIWLLMVFFVGLAVGKLFGLEAAVGWAVLGGWLSHLLDAVVRWERVR